MKKCIFLLFLVFYTISYAQYANRRIEAEYNYISSTIPSVGTYGMIGSFTDSDGRGYTVDSILVDTTIFRDINGFDYRVRAKSGDSPLILEVDPIGHGTVPSTGIGQLYHPTRNFSFHLESGGVDNKVRASLTDDFRAQLDSLLNVIQATSTSGGGSPIDTIVVSSPYSVLTPLHFNGVSWELASNAPSQLKFAWGIVVDSISADTVAIQSIGFATIPSHGLSVGQFYSLDSLTYTLSSNIDSSQYDQWLWNVMDANTIDIKLSAHVEPPEPTGETFNFEAGWIPVTQYGAVSGDAVDDSYAAKLSLSANNYVFFPPGTWQIDTTIQLNEGQTIIGTGYQSILNMNLAGDYGIVTDTTISSGAKTGYNIQGVRLTGQALNGIYYYRASRSNISNVHINTSGEVGFKAESNWGTRYENLVINGIPSQDTNFVFKSITIGNIENLYTSDTSLVNFYFYSCSAMDIQNIVAQAGNKGIQTLACSNLMFTNPYFEGCDTLARIGILPYDENNPSYGFGTSYEGEKSIIIDGGSILASEVDANMFLISNCTGCEIKNIRLDNCSTNGSPKFLMEDVQGGTFGPFGTISTSATCIDLGDTFLDSLFELSGPSLGNGFFQATIKRYDNQINAGSTGGGIEVTYRGSWLTSATNISWDSVGFDNLGNHIAEMDLDLAGFDVVNADTIEGPVVVIRDQDSPTTNYIVVGNNAVTSGPDQYFATPGAGDASGGFFFENLSTSAGSANAIGIKLNSGSGGHFLRGFSVDDSNRFTLDQEGILRLYYRGSIFLVSNQHSSIWLGTPSELGLPGNDGTNNARIWVNGFTADDYPFKFTNTATVSDRRRGMYIQGGGNRTDSVLVVADAAGAEILSLYADGQLDLDGAMKIIKGTSGATPSTFYDDFILEGGATGGAGMSFLYQDGDGAGIDWTSPTTPSAAGISYSDGDQLMWIGTTNVNAGVTITSGNGIETIGVLSNGDVEISNGNLGVGAAPLAANKLRLYDNNADSSGITYVEKLTHSSTGTPIEGMGVGHDYVLENAASVEETAGTISIVWDSTTIGDEASSILISVQDNSTLDTVIQISGNGHTYALQDPVYGTGDSLAYVTMKTVQDSTNSVRNGLRRVGGYTELGYNGTSESPGTSTFRQRTDLDMGGFSLGLQGNFGTDTLVWRAQSDGTIRWGHAAGITGTQYVMKFDYANKAFYLGDAISSSFSTAANSISMGFRNGASGIEAAAVGGDLSSAAAINSAVFGGSDGDIDASSWYAGIMAGRGNDLNGSRYAFMGGGWTNDLINSNYATIVGGINHYLTDAAQSVIMGGNSDTIAVNQYQGIYNSLTSMGRGKYSTIIGGLSLFNKSSYALTTGALNVPIYSVDSVGWTLTDPLFVIGKGTTSKNNNAVTILKNGWVQFNSLTDTLLNASKVTPDNPVHVVSPVGTDPLKVETLQAADSTYTRTMVVDSSGVVRYVESIPTSTHIFEQDSTLTMPNYGFLPIYVDTLGNIRAASTTSGSTVQDGYAVVINGGTRITVQTSGFHTVSTGHGLSVGRFYYLQDDGSISTTPDATINAKVCKVWSSTVVQLFEQRATQ